MDIDEKEGEEEGGVEEEDDKKVDEFPEVDEDKTEEEKKDEEGQNPEPENKLDNVCIHPPLFLSLFLFYLTISSASQHWRRRREAKRGRERWVHQQKRGARGYKRWAASSWCQGMSKQATYRKNQI